MALVYDWFHLKVTYSFMAKCKLKPLTFIYLKKHLEILNICLACQDADKNREQNIYDTIHLMIIAVNSTEECQMKKSKKNFFSLYRYALIIF